MDAAVEGALNSWGQLGVLTGIIVLVVTSIVRGWLKPKSSVDELIHQLEARLADRDILIAEQRKTIEALDKRNDLLADQVRQLVEIGHTSAAVLSALPKGGGQ